MTTDTGYAPERWEFDEKVTEVFDDMLTRSIPDYHTMRKLVAELVSQNVTSTSIVLDLGCSRGDNIASIMKYLKEKAPALYPGVKYIGVENSAPMVAAAKSALQEPIAAGMVDIQHHDIQAGIASYPMQTTTNINIVCSVLTLMFIPMEARQTIVENLYEMMPEGGAFILVEKMLGSSGSIQEQMVNAYYDMKLENGYSEEDIETKAQSLEGVLVPMTMSANIEMLKQAGFQEVDCFWRWMNFGGLLAMK